MQLNRLFLIITFISKFADLTAQKDYHTNLKYELSVKELLQPPKYDERWGFGGAYACSGSLTSILCCLLRIEDGRLKIKGLMPEKYLNVEITEPSKQNLGALLANSQTHPLGTQSLVTVTIGLLEKEYRFSVTDIEDTIDVWCLKIADTAKLVRYDEVRDTDNRGAGVDGHTNEWEATGMKLHYLCATVAAQSKAIIYDETQDTGIFTFTTPPIPVSKMRNVDTLNLFLETHYGLHFIKRNQLESLKLIEFK